MCDGDLTKRDTVGEQYTIVDAIKWLQLGKYKNWLEEQGQELNKNG